MMSGDLKEVEKRMENTFVKGGANMKGVGSTTEGFGVNPIMYEYVFDKAWSDGPVDVVNWVNNWSERRFGEENDTVRRAWNILLNTSYSGAAGLGRATLTNARPGLKGHNSWTTNPTINYDNRDLLKAWELLTEPRVKAPAVYYYDVVNVGRQVLGNYFSVLRDRFTDSYNNKDIDGLKKYGNAMLSLLDDMDTLLATNQNFLLGDWIASARGLGINEKEKNYFETDARKIITVWGEPGRHLTDYANRSLAGLTKTYYKGRWNLFVDQVEHDVRYNVSFDSLAFTKALTRFEDKWSRGHDHFPSTPSGDCMKISRMLIKKYAKDITEVKE